MSEYPYSGTHPDADSLSALAEGALPEHERAACLAHLAECSECREIVWLAQPAIAAERAPAMKTPFRKRWFAPLPAFAAAAACAVVASIAVYWPHKPSPESVELTASTPAPAEAAPPALPEQTEDRAHVTRAQPRAVRAPVQAEPQPASAEAAAVAAPSLPPAPPASALAAPQSATTLGEVAGTVTDPAGSVIAKAQVNLVESGTGTVFKSASDAGGQFAVPGLAPGHYELKINAPGFMETSKAIDLQPRQVARADSTLQIGATAETVTVTAEASLLRTETSSLSVLKAKASRTSAAVTTSLPSKLSAAATVTKDKLMVALDQAGALFFSNNAGKSWKPIKPRWQGKIVRLVTPPDARDAGNGVFQINTDSDAVWLSRDGNHWSPAPRR